MAGGLRRAVLPALALAAGLLGPAGAWAEQWGGIDPGATTIEQVRARYGAPSKETRAKTEGYDTIQWVYEAERAPIGLRRMTVDYGLLTSPGYKPTVVRVLRLEPKPKIFGRNTVVQAFGVPDGVTSQNDQDRFFYRAGLVVIFDKEGDDAVTLDFTLAQPEKPPAAAPKR
jgi:hypothetical protein